MSAPVLSLAEAAEYLGVKPSLLSRLARSHKIPYLKPGIHLLFNVEALDQYRQANEVPALAPNPYGLTDRSAARLARSLPSVQPPRSTG